MVFWAGEITGAWLSSVRSREGRGRSFAAKQMKGNGLGIGGARSWQWPTGHGVVASGRVGGGAWQRQGGEGQDKTRGTTLVSAWARPSGRPGVDDDVRLRRRHGAGENRGERGGRRW